MPGEKKNDVYDVLDISKLNDRNWLKDTFRDVSKASAAKQLSVGGVSGWVAGYIGCKIGKAAAAAVGGSLLVLQIAHYKGYIKVNWGQLEKDWKKAQSAVSPDTKREMSYKLSEVQQFARENVFLAGGFVCGLLVGLAS